MCVCKRLEKLTKLSNWTLHFIAPAIANSQDHSRQSVDWVLAGPLATLQGKAKFNFTKSKCIYKSARVIIEFVRLIILW